MVYSAANVLPIPEEAPVINTYSICTFYIVPSGFDTLMMRLCRASYVGDKGEDSKYPKAIDKIWRNRMPGQKVCLYLHRAIPRLS